MPQQEIIVSLNVYDSGYIYKALLSCVEYELVEISIKSKTKTN